jgi:hypothetical protein
MVFQKGQKPWNKGKKLHYDVWNKGKSWSQKIRNKIGKSKKGQIPWMKGKHHSPETIVKLRNSLKGRKVWNKGSHIQTNNALEKWRKSGGTSWNKGKKYPQITGEKHFNWKGGKFKQDGYILIYKPKHPFANKGYVFEHRLVIEQILGRYLKPEERVHHINGVKDDNRPKNLMYFANESDHQKYHQSLL